MRILVAVCLCLTFQGVQQHVVRTNRDSALQGAAHQKDGSPDHDWRRAGDGTTRALQTHPALDAPAPPASALQLLATALRASWQPQPVEALCARPPQPAPPLRV